jgi:tetratricopeptide (TPR) repeat protein
VIELGAFVEKKDRTIIPRWRTFHTTASLGEIELRAAPSAGDASVTDFLSDKLSEWKELKTLWHATDLVGSAIVLGREKEAAEAADFITAPDSGALEPARVIASLVHSGNTKQDTQIAFADEDDLAFTYRAIHALREQAAEQPRNSILWVDLALAYTILGRFEQAERAIRAALRYGGNNRFVLRSSARFYIHTGDFDLAHSILLKAEATPHDPWLMAAEIAAATAGKLHPELVKAAKSMIADRLFSPKDLSELAGAVGTVELENGNHGPARRFFKNALIAPNENSVAQVEWASDKITGLTVDPTEMHIPRLFEARAWDAFFKGNWDIALKDAKSWLLDQRFSSRPVLLAGYLSMEIFGNYKQASRILEAGRIANPDDLLLRNDLAYCYVQQGRIAEAWELMNSVDENAMSVPVRIAPIATIGLLNFRSNQPAQGRERYAEAIALADRAQLPAHKAAAAIILAREEIRLNSEFAPEAIRQAQNATAKFPRKDLVLMFDRLPKQATK